MLAFFTLSAFVAFMVGTPGPANLIVMLAGVRQGLRQSIGFILGLIVGKIALNLFVGFGFGLVLAKAPVWQMLFSYFSAGYVIWLALKSCQQAMLTPATQSLRRIISAFVPAYLFIR